MEYIYIFRSYIKDGTLLKYYLCGAIGIIHLLKIVNNLS